MYTPIFSVALTDGYNVFLDASQRPELQSSGVMIYNNRGIWRKCINRPSDLKATVVYDICQYLSFSDYLSYKFKSINGNNVNVVSTTPVTKPSSSQINCEVLFISCKDQVDTDLKIQEGPDEHVPWNANIYIEEKFRCRGSILNDTWIVCSIGCFANGILR